MICHKPLLAGCGFLPNSQIIDCCSSLAKYWGGDNLQYSADQCPQNLLSSIPKGKGLIKLIGDPAQTLPKGESWLSSLGSWKHPTILIAGASLATGDVFGNASAYEALCRDLSVPLVGLLHYGGQWNPVLRKLDGLPWCGWIPDKTNYSAQNEENFHSVEEVVIILQRRLYLLGF